MNHFQYIGNELYCEDVPVKKIAKEIGTPYYLYSYATLKRHYLEFYNAFEGLNRLVCFSAKANSNLAVLNLFARLGSGLDIVSGGELYRGLNAGFSPQKIVYSGVGKRSDEIDYALNSNILLFNVESFEELKLIDERAGHLGKKGSIAIRVNPDIDPKTHPYISTGLKKNKFGVDTKTALEAYKVASELENVDIVGIDCHIGSQIIQIQPFKDTLEHLLGLIKKLNKMGLEIRYLDMGGGLGITYNDESPPHPTDYAQAIGSILSGSSIELIFEPGRVISGNAGALVTQVLYRKQGVDKNFVITDAAMNDLLRPTLYDAFHAIKPVIKTNMKSIVSDIVGPICESADFMAKNRNIQSVDSGDLLAIMSTGAYGFTMSSNYCSRPRVGEVMVKGNQFEVVRARETYKDLIKGESILSF